MSRCPHCGLEVSPPDAWYDVEDRGNENSPVAMFCSQAHALAFHDSHDQAIFAGPPPVPFYANFSWRPCAINKTKHP